MATVSDIQKTIWTWAYEQAGLSGDKVIWESANAPRPARPYVSLNFSTIARFGDIDVTDTDNLGIRQILANNYWTLVINSFGTNDASKIDAQDMLETLKLSLKKDSVVLYLNDNFISVVNSLNITNISQIMGSGYEQRSAMDIILYIVTAIDDDVGLIEHIAMEGKFLNFDGSTEKEVDININ